MFDRPFPLGYTGYAKLKYVTKAHISIRLSMHSSYMLPPVLTFNNFVLFPNDVFICSVSLSE
jgi:hypothetical protein